MFTAINGRDLWNYQYYFLDKSKETSDVDPAKVLYAAMGAEFKFELLANRQSTSFSVDRGLFSPKLDLGDIDLSFYQVGLLYNWGRGQVNPYIGASLGVARIDPKLGSPEAQDRFAGSITGGVKIFFNRNVGLRLEARGYWANIDSGTNPGHRSNNSNEALYQGEGSAGLILAW